MHGTALPFQPGPAIDRAPFRLGATTVDPVLRTLDGPGGATTVEPRVMQVLVALAGSAGSVVTRDRLLLECWQGRFVGEDALNRAIGEVRRLARTYSAGAFTIETITRTGYRLDGAVPVSIAPEPATGVRPSRRALLLGAGSVGVAAITGWALWPRAADPRATALFDEAGIVLRNQSPGFETRALALLRQAQAIAPDDAAIAGRLAIACEAVAERAPPAQAAAALEATMLAARRALAIDPNQPEARVVQATIAPAFGDWLRIERQLRAILADHPGNPVATGALAMVLGSVGRVSEASAFGLARARADPLSPSTQYRSVYGLWQLGRYADMDRVADRAAQLWPQHPGVWFVRLWTLAFTGRAALALAFFDETGTRPALTPPVAAVIRRSLLAMAYARPDDVRRAIDENVAASRASPLAAINATMILAELGALDAAFAVTDGYLRRRGPAAGSVRMAAGDAVMREYRQRKTMMLFVPVTEPLRRDPRFRQLCDAIGLSDYWRASGSRPDFLRAA